MMTKDDEHRITTSDGAVLIDPSSLGAVEHATPSSLFEPAFWAARGELERVVGGRGAAWFVAASPRQWALRHFRRGGLIARFSSDRYLWQGERRVRAFAEWRMLVELTRRGLPVPRPIAARYQRTYLTYRCDLITERIKGAHPLSHALAQGPLQDHTWRAVGAVLARLHAAGAHHADLNSHNVLLTDGDAVSVIDFDRGRLREPGAWGMRNLSRLHRSLVKVASQLPPGRFSAAAWHSLLQGYAPR